MKNSAPRLILIAFVFSSLLLGLITTPARASTAGNTYPHQESNPQDTDPGLSGVILRLEDMPAGFEILPDTQQQAMSTALGQIARGLGTGTQMSTQNVSGFWNADARNPQFVVSLLIYPLSKDEQRTYDNSLRDPEQIIRAMGQMLNADTQAELLAGIEDIGETSIGFTVSVNAGSRNLLMEIISARRSQVVEQILVTYFEGQEPAADVRQVARILDGRLEEAVGGPAGAYRPTALLVPKLTTHIPTPLDLSTDPAVVGTNLLLSAIVMIFLTIAVELANHTLEENEHLLQRLFHPLGALRRLSGRANISSGKLRTGVALSLLGLGILILIYGLTFSLLEPGWNLLSVTGLWLFACLTIGGGVVGLADEILQWFSARKWGVPTGIRLRPGNLLIALTSTGFSRLFGVVPGFMFGSPQAIDIDTAALEKPRQTRLVLTGVTTALVIGLALWLVTIFTNLLQRGSLPDALSVAIGGLESLFLSIFALAVQNGFVQMLALPNTYGRLLQRRNRWAWLLLLLGITFLFYHTLINPKGNLASAWSSVNVVVFMVTAAAGMVLSFLVWLGFRLVNTTRQAETAPAGEVHPVGPVFPAPEAEIPTAPQPAVMKIALPAAEAEILPAPQPAAVETALPAQTGVPASFEAAFPVQADLPAALEAAQPPAADLSRPLTPTGLSGETKTCPSCGKLIMAEARFCPFCAAKIVQDQPSPATRPCPQCGCAIPLESQFCSFCGARLAAKPGQPAAPARLAAQPVYAFQPPRRRNYWPIIVLAGGVLALLGCAALAGIGWWQREHIPLLAGLLNQPSATSTPRPTRTARPTSTPRPTMPPPPTAAPMIITAVPQSPIRMLCLLPAGIVNDNGFNTLAWTGVQSVAAQYNAQSVYLEPASANPNYLSTLYQLIPQDCDLIVGVGFLTADAIRQAALEFPQQRFLLLDASLDTPLPNVWSQTYAADQGAFLAGYLAASVSRTGKVGVYGGYDIPVIRDTMNGFASGVSYYNALHNASVQVLGWDIISQTGLFSNDFSNPQQGQILARQLISQGADVIFPVAGATSYGTAAEATTHSGVYVIGVDYDWAASKPEYAGIMLTSVEKRLGSTIELAVASIPANSFNGGNHTGTLWSEIALSPYHNQEWLVPDWVRAELKQVTADILGGKINTRIANGPVIKPAEPQELTIWVSDSTPPHLDRWAAKYEQANPGVKISIEAVPSADIIYQWQTNVAAGQGADMLLYGSALMFPDWATLGMMRPLDDYLPDRLDEFSNAALANVTVYGAIYGVPYQAYSLALYYNKSLLPTPPGTMDELAYLVSQGKKITLLQSMYFMFGLFTAFDGELVDPGGRCIADQNGGFVAALEYLQALSRDGAIITSDYGTTTAQFSSGQAAMTINGLWTYTDFKNALGDDLGVAFIPSGVTHAAPLSGVNAFLINPNSRSPQLAVDLALFLASPESQADLDEYYIPVRTDLAAVESDFMNVFAQSAAMGYPEIVLTNNFYGPFEAMLANVLSGSQDPASAVQEACRQMNALNGK